MPWNFVSCASSSDSAPVSTQVSPSAIVPRSARLRSLIPSLADGGRSSIDIAEIPSFASQRIQLLVADDPLQRGVYVLGHCVGIATDIDGGALLHPSVQIPPRIPQRVLHVALVRLV